MTPRASISVAAAACLLPTGAPLEAQTTTPLVVVVLDDTKLFANGQARLAATGVEAVHRTLMAGPVRVGAITSGPGGLMIDATDDTSVVPPIVASLREGVYDFTGTPDPDKANRALDATVRSVVSSMGRLEGPQKVLVVIGRSARVSAERRTALETYSAGARRAGMRVVSLDLDGGGCDAASPRDATTLSEPAACAPLADAAAVARAWTARASSPRRALSACAG
jgi:hypothetical protein